MTPEELAKIDLNAPAFSNKVETPQIPAGNEEKTEEGQDSGSQKPDGEDGQVPYSRFKKFHDEAKHLREEVAELRQKMEQRPLTPTQQAEEIPQEWIDLYGDADASKRAWQIQQGFNNKLLEQAREEVRQTQFQETKRVESNVNSINDQIEDLSSWLGRSLTDKEESELLDIVDEYTPKDEYGNYAGALLPFDKAWEIRELKNQNATASRRTSRDSVARISASPSEGEPSIQAERDKNFNPLEVGAWRRALGKR